MLAIIIEALGTLKHSRSDCIDMASTVHSKSDSSRIVRHKAESGVQVGIQKGRGLVERSARVPCSFVRVFARGFRGGKLAGLGRISSLTSRPRCTLVLITPSPHLLHCPSISRLVSQTDRGASAIACGAFLAFHALNSLEARGGGGENIRRFG